MKGVFRPNYTMVRLWVVGEAQENLVYLDKHLRRK